MRSHACGVNQRDMQPTQSSTKNEQKQEEDRRTDPLGQWEDPRCAVEGANPIFKAKVEYPLAGKMNRPAMFASCLVLADI